MVKFIASFFCIGYLPLMSGTYASIAGLLIFFLLRSNYFYLQVITAIIVVLGFITCGRAEKELNEKDSSKIVIDEVSGMLICLCFISATFFQAIVIFLLFRIFDILKPFPINKAENLKGSLGIMLDDIIAAFYAIGVFYIAKQIFLTKT